MGDEDRQIDKSNNCLTNFSTSVFTPQVRQTGMNYYYSNHRGLRWCTSLKIPCCCEIPQEARKNSQGVHTPFITLYSGFQTTYYLDVWAL